MNPEWKRDREWMIRSLRRLGMSQPDMARKLGVHEVTVYRWGTTSPVPKYAKEWLQEALEHDYCKQKYLETLSILRPAAKATASRREMLDAILLVLAP
jgi:transposase